MDGLVIVVEDNGAEVLDAVDELADEVAVVQDDLGQVLDKLEGVYSEAASGRWATERGNAKLLERTLTLIETGATQADTAALKDLLSDVVATMRMMAEATVAIKEEVAGVREEMARQEQRVQQGIDWETSVLRSLLP